MAVGPHISIVNTLLSEWCMGLESLDQIAILSCHEYENNNFGGGSVFCTNG